MKHTVRRLMPCLHQEDMQQAITYQKLFEQQTQSEEFFSHYQTPVWANFLSWLLGKGHVEFWALQADDGAVAAMSWVYLYPLKKGKYWVYTPRGPLGVAAGELLQEVARAHAKNAVWIRWDPLYTGDEARHFMTKSKAAHTSFHPKSTLLLDLTSGAEAVLAQMKSKGRYNIRLAAKKGVQVHGWQINQQGELQAMALGNDETGSEPASAHNSSQSALTLQEVVSIYTTLSRETNARDGFSGHGESYFAAFLKNMPEKAYILLAEAEGEWIAGGIFLQQGALATYYYGASSSKQREKMAPYLVQWTAIEYAIRSQCRTYDFLGVATPGSADPSDTALAGVTDFKLKFGGQIVTHGKAWEKVLNPSWFWMVRGAKSIRRIISRIKRA